MGRSIPLKTSADVLRLARPARFLESVLRELAELVQPGVTTKDLDRFCADRIAGHGPDVEAAGYPRFPATAATSVNVVAAHGIPNDVPLEDGDVVTVDLTVRIGDWMGDAAWTYLIGSESPETRRLLRAAWQCTLAGIAACKAGSRLGDVGHAISRTARRYGCSVLKEFTGHGIGRRLHEEPSVPNIGEPGTGEYIVPGMVLNIEPVVSLGGDAAELLPDGWSYVTVDGSLTAQYEHTVAVYGNRTEILTLTHTGATDLDFPPYH